MELQKYNFVPAGNWVKRETVNSGITFELTALARDRVVYAFVVDNQTKYIGICDKDTTSLQDRMQRYKSLAGGSTNKRVAGKIKQCLADGKSVQIFALKPESKFQHVDLNIDLVKGLENPLIERFKPEWNL